MLDLYDRYQQGFYQEVYDDLVHMHDHVFEEPTYTDALLVAREIMKRVRSNLELLIPRLHTLGFQFGKGFWQEFDDLSAQEKATIEKEIPILGTPTSETSTRVGLLEQLTGPLPLSLRCWYEEVGSVNLIGLFPDSDTRNFSSEYGCILDPLFIYPVDIALQMVTRHTESGVWQRDSTLPLSPDNYYKYGYSGSGAYTVNLPCKAFDAPLLLEKHCITFVNYLRLCFQWGGFPGLETENRLTSEEMHFLTQGLRAF